MLLTVFRWLGFNPFRQRCQMLPDDIDYSLVQIVIPDPLRRANHGSL